MKILMVSLFSLGLSTLATAGTTMKVEGTCSGKLKDGTSVSYTYYSNFNGCRAKSSSAVSFKKGLSGLHTGTRSFTDDYDNYSFPTVKLRFANSTGNTSGKLTYRDSSTGRNKTVTVRCEVRDYGYSEC